MNFFKKAKKGFTLVELVVVIAVIAILAAVSVGAYFGVTESANNSRLEQETKQLHTTISSVALSGNSGASLDSKGLTITDPGTFEKKIEESLGKEVFLTDVENSKHETEPTICFSTNEYSAKLGGATLYKTFEYHLPDINGKKVIANLITGDFNIATAETTVADPFESKVWYLVKDASELSVGDDIVIVATNYNFAMGSAEKNSNRPVAAVTKEGNKVTIGNDVLKIKLEQGAVEGTFAFNSSLGYLMASSSSSNNLIGSKTFDANGSWKIEINENVASIVAQGSNTRNTIKYNHTSSLFSAYLSSYASGKEVSIYKAGYEYDSLCKHNFGENLPTCTYCGVENPDYIAPVEPAVNDATVAQLKTYEVTNAVAYNVTGYIIGWNGNNNNIHKDGRFYIADSLADSIENGLLVYGASTVVDTLKYSETDGYSFNNDDVELDVNNYKIGDQISMKGFLIKYVNNNTQEEVIEFNGIITNLTAQNVTLNVTNGENTTNYSFTKNIFVATVESINANDVITATVTNGETVVYTYNFTADKAGTWELTYNFLEKRVTGICTIEAGETSTSLSFRDDTNRTSFSTTEHVFANDIITFTNTKANSGSDIVNNTNPIRCYASSEILITIADGKNITSIEFDADTSYFADGLSHLNQLIEGSVTVDGSKIIVNLLKPCNQFKLSLPSQFRLYSVKVSYNIEDSVGPSIVKLNTKDITLKNYSVTPIFVNTVLSDFTSSVANFEDLEYSFINTSLFDITTDGIQVKEGVTSSSETVTVSLKDDDTISTTFVVTINIDLVGPKATFEFGSDGETTHYDNNSDESSYSETNNGYTLNITGASKFYPNSRDAQGRGMVKLGTRSATATFTVTVPEDVNTVTFYVSGYKANKASININGATYAINTCSNNIEEYTPIVIDTSTVKSITFETNSSPDERACIDKIIFN